MWNWLMGCWLIVMGALWGTWFTWRDSFVVMPQLVRAWAVRRFGRVARKDR
jgi:hypothetical protein